MDKTIAVDRVLQTDYISNLFFRVLSNGFATRVSLRLIKEDTLKLFVL